MLTGHLSLGLRPGCDWAIRDIGQNVLQYSSKKKAAAATVTSTFSVFSHSSKRPLVVI